MQEKVYGVDTRVVEVIYHLLKLLQPGSLDEQDHLQKLLTSPNPCREPAAALKELRRWFAAMTRAVEIGMVLPGLDLLYRGARSIYSGAFEGDDFGLRLRWTTIEQNWGFPHRLSHEGLRAINQFAEAELGAMIVSGRGSANTSLPLTETQKSRVKGEKEAEKKRAAAATNSPASEQQTVPAVSAGVMVNGQRCSSSTSTWADVCSSWKDKGFCSRGISCWFQHTGFPTHGSDGKPVLRCVVCGKNDHTSKECKAPGGQLDPDREKSWEQYRARREEAQTKGKTKGKKGKGKSKGNDHTAQQQQQAPAGKGGASQRPKAKVKAARVAAADATDGGGDFPAGACGLDSWANVWLKHVDSSTASHQWSEPLRLADGSSTPCRTCIGLKGIPQALLEKRQGQENIDLVPTSWLIDRWCDVQWNDKVVLITPRQQKLILDCWHGLPYLTAEQLKQTLGDLPEPGVPGRSGKAAGARVASASIVLGPCACAVRFQVAPEPGTPRPGDEKIPITTSRPDHEPPQGQRFHQLADPGAPPVPVRSEPGYHTGPAPDASTADLGGLQGQSSIAASGLRDERPQTKQAIRVRLKHLEEEIDKEKREKMVKKYQCMPDLYYDGESFVGPEELGEDTIMDNLGLVKGAPVQLWEFMAGSGKLSATARAQNVSHLPPVDHRWGYHLGRFADQVKLLYVFLVYGCEVLFASPTCTPWGNNSRGWDKQKLRRDRAWEGLSLQFLTMLCLLQVVMGRSYIIENPKDSDMYTESPISLLQHESLPWHRRLLDQCQFGASMDGGLLRKSTELHSDQSLPELDQKCAGDHEHAHLRGNNKNGSSTAQSAVYPDALCHTIVQCRSCCSRSPPPKVGGESASTLQL